MTITPSELGDLFREHGELRHVNLGTEDEPIESCERWCATCQRWVDFHRDDFECYLCGSDWSDP